jgi:hypothetical protein
MILRFAKCAGVTMTLLSGLQPPLGRRFLSLRKAGGPRALHPAFSFAPVALAGVLLAGSLAQTGLALLRDTTRRSVVEAGWLGQTVEPMQRDIPESRIRLRKLDDSAATMGDRIQTEFAEDQAH